MLDLVIALVAFSTKRILICQISCSQQSLCAYLLPGTSRSYTKMYLQTSQSLLAAMDAFFIILSREL